jgi:hypothetical protein
MAGDRSGRERVRESGLWNNDHVEDEWDPGVLEQLEIAAESTANPRL